MRTAFKVVFTTALLFLSLTVSAQRSGRTKDPTLNKGEGLEVTRSDLDKMRNKSQDKNSRQVDIYMFAASFSLIDSVLYISNIQKIDNVTVNNKWFVKDRVEYEAQFTNHVSAVEGLQLTSVTFSDKEKKVIRQRSKLIRRNAKKNRFVLRDVYDFRFSTPASEVSDN